MEKRRIRNINITDLGDARPYNRILRLSSRDEGVCFRFSLPKFDDEFLSYADECIEICKSAGVKNYKFSLVTHNPDSSEHYLKTATRVISSEELERLIELETRLPDTASLVITEKYETKFMDFSLSEAIQANEFVNQEVAYIKSLNLSPFEEYLMAYDVTSLVLYNEEEDKPELWYLSRLLNSALTQEYFVCVAHSKLLNGMLSGLGIDSQIQRLLINAGTKGHREDELHNNLMVFLNDEKYHFNGIVFSDACNDASAAKYLQTRRGDSLIHQESQNSFVLSAINIDDVQNMRKIFTFEDDNFLKFLYKNTAALTGDDFQSIFDGFDDEWFSSYFNFFIKNYPQFKELQDYDRFLNEEDFEMITGDCSDYALAKMLETFGNIEVATAVEKADLSFDDETLVIYSSELVKLFMQVVILKFNNISETEINAYVQTQKPKILEGISMFDKEHEINRVFEHNAYIASKYSNDVEAVTPVDMTGLFTEYKSVATDSYASFMLYCFSHREQIASMLQEVRMNSPVVDLTDYVRAYIRILTAQGVSEEKAIGYVSEKIKDAISTSDSWFDEKSTNCFKLEANRMWVEKNAKSAK